MREREAHAHRHRERPDQVDVGRASGELQRGEWDWRGWRADDARGGRGRTHGRLASGHHVVRDRERRGGDGHVDVDVGVDVLLVRL